MPDQYPFTLSNRQLDPVLRRVRTAAKPERLTQELLATWGFTASNDRAIPRVLKALDFLSDNGVPTPEYDRLRDPNDWKIALADALRRTYSDLFAIDPNVHSAAESEVRGAISRITGKDEATVRRYYATFKALCSLAEWNTERRSNVAPTSTPEQTSKPTSSAVDTQHASSSPNIVHRQSEYHYNIQIHLPVTTDITVYNAIFKSLRDNLGV